MASQLQIPAQVKEDIIYVVEHDEGGWVLTEDPNDTDGGWTFAGIISKNWLDYLQSTKVYDYKDSTHVLQLLKLDIANHSELAWKDRAVEIYYEKFWLPMQAISSTSAFTTCEFSCYIQCPDHFDEISASAILMFSNDANKSWTYRKAFCKAWLDHYAELVKKNTEAWKRYALDQEGILNHTWKSGKAVDKPQTLRATYLHGWINRVWRYMP